MHRTESLYYGFAAELALNRFAFRFPSAGPSSEAGLLRETEALSPSIAAKASPAGNVPATRHSGECYFFVGFRARLGPAYRARAPSSSSRTRSASSSGSTTLARAPHSSTQDTT